MYMYIYWQEEKRQGIDAADRETDIARELYLWLKVRTSITCIILSLKIRFTYA